MENTEGQVVRDEKGQGQPQDEYPRWPSMGCKPTNSGGEGGVDPYPGPFCDDRV